MKRAYLKEYGSQLLDNGYPIVPIKPGTKHPGYDNWQKTNANPTLLQRWISNGYARAGVGIQTATVPGVDLDIRDPEITAMVVNKCVEWFGDTVKRIGQQPKILLAYRCEQPFSKLSSHTYTDPFGQEHRIEILANGQQFVAYAVHPGTGEPYEWVGGQSLLDVPREKLPELTREQATAFLEWFEANVPDDWEIKARGTKESHDTLADLEPEDYLDNLKPPLNLSDKQVKRALSYIDPEECDYDRYITVGMALYHQYRGAPKGFEYWDDWCYLCSKYVEGYGERKWRSFREDLARSYVTFATVVKWAKEARRRESVGDKGFQLVHAADVLARLGPVDWQVHNYLEANTTGLLFGDPGSYKSFLAMDLALHCAAGKDWHGNTVKQGPVIYVAGEGHGGFARRLAAWEKHHDANVADYPIYFSQQAAHFYDLESAELVQSVIDNLVKAAGRPVMIVVDTLARNFGGGDENSTADMNTFIDHVDRYLRAAYGCTVMIVHHTGHANKERARGSMALKGALDYEYRIERPPGAMDTDYVARMVCTKMKDAVEPAPAVFKGESITVGFDDDEPITSLVFEPGDEAEYGSAVDLKGKQKACYELLQNTLESADEGLARKALQQALVDEEIVKNNDSARYLIRDLVKKGYLFDIEGFIYVEKVDKFFS